MTDTTRWQARVAHATAAATVPWQHASLAVGLIGLASVIVRGVAASSTIGLAVLILHSALLGTGLWLGLRLRIDAVLFWDLAGADGTGSFDRAMMELGMLNASKAGRPLPDRVRGLMRLVRLLALVVAAQLAVLVLAGWLGWQ